MHRDFQSTNTCGNYYSMTVCMDTMYVVTFYNRMHRMKLRTFNISHQEFPFTFLKKSHTHFQQLLENT